MQKHPPMTLRCNPRTLSSHSGNRTFIVYDHQRTPLGEVLMASITEEDIRAGKPVTDITRFRQVISSLSITNP